MQNIRMLNEGLAAPVASKFYRVADNYYGGFHYCGPSEVPSCHFVEGTGPWAGTYSAHMSFGRKDTFEWIGDSLSGRSRSVLGVLEPIHRITATGNMVEFVVLCMNGRVLEVHVGGVGRTPADQAAGRVLHLLRGGQLDLCRLGASKEMAARNAGLMISRLIGGEAWSKFGWRLSSGEVDPPWPPTVDVATLPAWEARGL